MTISIQRRSFLAAGAAASMLPASRARAAAVEIAGAGSSFIRPVMQRWITETPATLGVKASYTAIGTGTAQSRILAGDLDFAVVELPLPAETLAGGNLIQFPVAFGALVCVVNIEGVKTNQLRLNGSLLAAIFGGVIKKWNDPRITAANPGLTLPDQDIRPLYVAEPNGAVFSSTATLTQYLLATSPEWQQKYGSTVPKRWAVGSMVGSAELMMQNVGLLAGAIGYVPLATVIERKLTAVALTNKSGKTVTASLDTLHAAVSQIDWAKTPDLVPRLLDLPGDASWPIVLSTYALIQQRPKNPAHGVAVRAFFNHVVIDGDAGAAPLQAEGLPKEAHAVVLGQLGGQRG